MSAVNFNVILQCNKDWLKVTIETPRLELHSVQEIEIEDYQKLLADRASLDFIGDPPNLEEVADRIKYFWAKRWQENDPYSAFSIRTKEKKLLGFISIDAVGDGRVTLNGVCKKKTEGRGYEAVFTLFENYFPYLEANNLSLKKTPLELEVIVSLTSINAKVLKDKGFKLVREEVRDNNQIWGVFTVKV